MLLPLATEVRIPAFFRQGALIAAYTDSAQGMFITYGKITGMAWCEKYFTWLYDIHTFPHNTLISQIQPCLRPVSPSESRMNFCLIRNPLDRQ